MLGPYAYVTAPDLVAVTVLLEKVELDTVLISALDIYMEAP